MVILLCNRTSYTLNLPSKYVAVIPKLISDGVQSILFHLNNNEIKFSFSVCDKLYIVFVLSGGNFDITDDYWAIYLSVQGK
jgi:hypothetical protein